MRLRATFPAPHVPRPLVSGQGIHRRHSSGGYFMRRLMVGSFVLAAGLLFLACQDENSPTQPAADAGHGVSNGKPAPGDPLPFLSPAQLALSTREWQCSRPSSRRPLAWPLFQLDLLRPMPQRPGTRRVRRFGRSAHDHLCPRWANLQHARHVGRSGSTAARDSGASGSDGHSERAQPAGGNRHWNADNAHRLWAGPDRCRQRSDDHRALAHTSPRGSSRTSCDPAEWPSRALRAQGDRRVAR